MSEQMTYEVFCLSLAALVLTVIVLLVLCCLLRQIRNRNITELQVSAGQPSCKLTIRTKPDHADQLLGHLLDRMFFQVNAGLVSEGESPEDVGSQTGGEFVEEVGLEPQQNLREEFESYPDTSPSTSQPQRAASHQTSPVDQTNSQSYESQPASSSSKSSSSTSSSEEYT